MSRLDERAARIDLERVHDKALDITVATVRAPCDEMWTPRDARKTSRLWAPQRKDAVDDRAEIETAMVELGDEPLLKSRRAL